MLKHVVVRNNYQSTDKWFVIYTPRDGKALRSYGQPTVPTHDEIEHFLRYEAYAWHPDKLPETAYVTITGYAEEQKIKGDGTWQDEYFYSPTWDCYMPYVDYSEIM